MSTTTVLAFGYVFIALIAILATLALWLIASHIRKAVIFTRRLYVADDSLTLRQAHRVFWYAVRFDADCVSMPGRRVYFPGREP